MRLGVYTDQTYRREGEALFADEAFAVFAARLRGEFDRLMLVGRFDPSSGRSHHRLPADVELAPLPPYPALSRPLGAAGPMARSLRRLWRVLGEVDAVWLLGPHPLALLFALMALARRRTVVLGVRQDIPAHIRTRHPGRRGLQLAAVVLEAAWRLLSRRCPVVVVGSDLARRYGRAPRSLTIAVSVVSERDLVPLSSALERRWDGDLQILSVGRLDPEKNPLLLADVLARLRRQDGRWRLVACGGGAMQAALGERLEELGVREHAELRGYLSPDDGLLEIYRTSHAFLHVSWTEGVPQVLFEAFAAGLPVVATAVGGVPEVADGRALLIPPGDADAAAAGLRRLAGDESLRARLVEAGLEAAREHSAEAECRRVATFIRRSTD